MKTKKIESVIKDTQKELNILSIQYDWLTLELERLWQEEKRLDNLYRSTRKTKYLKKANKTILESYSIRKNRTEIQDKINNLTLAIMYC